MYYYFWQTASFREGTREELRRFHMDYDPAETKAEALANAISWFTWQHAYFLEAANQRLSRLNEAKRLFEQLQEHKN
jgi:hypothetical protein